MSRFARAAFALITPLLLLPTAPAQAGELLGDPVHVELPGLGHDLVFDVPRDLLYVSLPANNEVVVVSTVNYQIVDTLFLGQAPRGIALSPDGSTLYAALNASGSVAAMDLETRAVETIDVTDELGNSLTWDVSAPVPGAVFVSANPGSGGFAWIVRIDTQNGNTAARVANNTIIRCAPVFAEDGEGEFLYVGACFSPNSLYKLDITQTDAPIVLEDDHGSVGGTNHLALNPSGSRILLRSGQVLRTSSFNQDGVIAGGPSTVSEDGALAYVAVPPNALVVHDLETYQQVDEFTLPCSFSTGFNTIETLRRIPGGGFLTLDDDLLCGVANVSSAGLSISPPSGAYFTSQSFDVVARVSLGGQELTDLRVFLDGQDVSERIAIHAVPGRVSTGDLSVRYPDLRFIEPGTVEIEVRIELDGETLLSESVTYEVEAVLELP